MMLQQKIFRVCLLTVCLSNLFFPNAYALQKKQPIVESWELFHPVEAEHAMVATQNELGSAVGKLILQQGGNAVDAAVAVGFALAVTLPNAGNIGGGGFMLIWLNSAHRAVAINYRECAPMSATAKLFLDKKSNVSVANLTENYLSSGVPGTVAGLCLAQQRFGKLSLQQVMAPAIELARNGFIVNEGLAFALEESEKKLKRSPDTRRIFLRSNNNNYQFGDRLIQNDLANTLEIISREGPQAFYEGAIAKKIVSAMEEHGGLITAKDLKDYKVQILKPLQGTYRGYQIISMPLPSSGGVTLIELLNVLEGFPLKEMGFNSAKYIHVLTEAMNNVYADRNFYLGDPRFLKVPLDKLLSKNYAKSIRKKIDLERHTPSEKIAQQFDLNKESRQTTHYTIVDKQGNIVSNTYTLNESFGNGIVVPGTGMLLNNEMDDFTAKPGVANDYGLVQGKNNLIEPGKQPLSSMTPTIVLRADGKPWFALGSPGGSHIITVVLQVIVNVIDHQFNLATSVNTPRFHSQLWPDVIYLEQGFSDDTRRLLRKMGHSLEQTQAMGSVQAVLLDKGKVFGVADPRRASAIATGY